MQNSIPNLYLASQSPRRHKILTNLGIMFKTLKSPYEENLSDVRSLPPEDLAAKLASLKAVHAAKAITEGLVIGADTIVVQGDNILGKPDGKDHAEMMLKALSGKSHRVITGIALIDLNEKRTFAHAETTYVYFRELSAREIELYLACTEPYDKAGAYGIQGRAGLFVERIEGCYFNVVGFPVGAFKNLICKAGFEIEDFIHQR